MAAFAEMGVHPDLVTAVEQQGWLLPTPIQTEAIPLILGGGDVMGAAETGSGKTAAFALPVLQIVHETLATQARGGAQAAPASQGTEECKLNAEDRDDVIAITPDGLRCQARDQTGWGGVRATVGAFQGKLYYEAQIADEGLCRVGWSLKHCSLDLGTQLGSFGYGGTGKKSSRRQFDDYGSSYGLDDVIGCLLDHDQGTISFSKNGENLGMAFQLDGSTTGQPLFPAISLKNAELVLNFGRQPFRYRPPGFVGIANAPKEALVSGDTISAASSAKSKGGRKPTALILEPSKDLAEQTAKVIGELQGYLSNPSLRSTALLGGEPIVKQARQLAEGVDIITGTPGRLMDLIESGKLATDAIQFFVLDEADRLLDTGNLDTILKMYSRFPKGNGAARLQVLMFSATLHSEEVKKVAAKICQNPILVDLKGKEAIPESVDHVHVQVDPRSDRSWLQNSPQVSTDNVHVYDATGPQVQSKENWSQGVKRLKPRILQRIIDQYKMDQCLIFCRTNFDCDNLESFLNGLGGGRGYRGKMEKGKENPYSCLVLAGQRSMSERREALQAFKDGDIRFLICTDVAARGIDIAGLPYLINMTLPDRSEDYIHRVGRVGRADRLGLAISLVAQVKEQVWYCRAKGYKPWFKPTAQDVKTHEEGGHTIWYSEPELLKEIEERLHQPIPAVAEDLSLPQAIRMRLQGNQQGSGPGYGEERTSTRSQDVKEHQEMLRPAVTALSKLERQAQWMYYDIQNVGAAKPVAGR